MISIVGVIIVAIFDCRRFLASDLGLTMGVG